MKLKFSSLAFAALAILPTTFLHAEDAHAPKKLLVVTTTTGFRHSSIPTLEKVIADLGAQSHAFTVDFVHQPEGKPATPKKPAPINVEAPEADRTVQIANMVKYKEDFLTYTTAETAWEEELKKALMKLSPESLKDYDGVVFASTTGELPIPDRAGFLAWIKSGKAFIGIHAASDTFHKWPEYLEMLGGEFKKHGKQVPVECLVQDDKHPATKDLGKSLSVTQEEIYQFNKFEPTHEHELLMMDKHPETGEAGSFPVSWCHSYGEGKVFYTSLGHREDVIDTDPNIKDRKNSVEVAKAYEAHLLGGIKWALGLEPGSSIPQAKAP